MPGVVQGVHDARRSGHPGPRRHGEVLRGHRGGAGKRGDVGACVQDAGQTDGFLHAGGVAEGSGGDAVRHHTEIAD